jgi:hypothetical protein
VTPVVSELYDIESLGSDSNDHNRQFDDFSNAWQFSDEERSAQSIVPTNFSPPAIRTPSPTTHICAKCHLPRSPHRPRQRSPAPRTIFAPGVGTGHGAKVAAWCSCDLAEDDSEDLNESEEEVDDDSSGDYRH